MKNILCYGDSNTHGSPPYDPALNAPRYGTDVRWGSVMRTILGAEYWVVEEGLGGRTTVWDDPVEGLNRNGKTFLMTALESHQPLDLVIVMLGTNDLKSRFAKSAADIAYGAGSLLDVILKSGCGPNYSAPKALLVCPAPTATLNPFFADMFAGAAEKSRQLAPFYQKQAELRGCAFLDAGKFITSSDRDGIHLEASEQQKLGQAVASKVREILA